MLGRLGVLRLIWRTRRREGRNVAELEFYTTDDLRGLYQRTEGDIISLRDGIVTRLQLAAEIRWRAWWARSGYWLLLIAALCGALFSFLAWRFPLQIPLAK